MIAIDAYNIIGWLIIMEYVNLSSRAVLKAKLATLFWLVCTCVKVKALFYYQYNLMVSSDRYRFPDYNMIYRLLSNMKSPHTTIGVSTPK